MAVGVLGAIKDESLLALTRPEVAVAVLAALLKENNETRKHSKRKRRTSLQKPLR